MQSSKKIKIDYTSYDGPIKELLLMQIGPIGNVEEKTEENKEPLFKTLLESAGTDIQTVLDNNDISCNTKEFILTSAIGLDRARFDALLGSLLPPLVDPNLKNALKSINNFCVDNEVEFKIEGYGLFPHNQTRTTSRHFFWSMTSLQRLVNQDDLDHPRTPPGEPLIQGMTSEDRELADYISKTMQKEAKSMVGKTLVFLGKIKLLYAAIESRDVSELADLLNKYKAFCNIAINNETLLLFAAKKERLDLGVIRALLEAKADPNQARIDGITVLMLAVYTGRLDIVDALLEAKADPNQARIDGITALILAAQLGHLDIVRALLEVKADPNQARTDDGTTALILAAQLGHLDIVRALLEAKADPNQAATNDGVTALMLAVYKGRLDIVDALLEAKADPNQARTDNGMTALMLAAQLGHLDVVRALLKAKADPNQARMDGVTPLMIAVDQGKPDIVKILLEMDADPEKASHNGVTPLNITPSAAMVPPAEQSLIRRLLQEAITNKKGKFESTKQKGERNEDDAQPKRQRH